MDNNFDAIIIGAGIVGVTSALALTNAGMKVLVVDRGNIASGTTSAGEGNILVSDKGPGPELELALHSRDAWFEINVDVGGGFELEAKGGVVVARSEAGVKGLFELTTNQVAAGVTAQDLDAQELHKLEPNLSHAITHGAFYPQDSQCQPMLATAVIMKTVKDRGGILLPRVNVLTIEVNNERVSGIKTNQGVFHSPVVVNAAGTWAGEVAKLAGASLPIAPRRGFILVTVPTKKLVFHKVYDAEYVANVSSAKADLQSSAVVESTQAGNILIGASRERVGFKAGIDYSVVRILARQAIELFPILSDLQLLRVYGGFRPYAPDHLPVISEDPMIKGLWHNAGHEGAGIGLAPASARLIADAILGKPSFMDAGAFDASRFISKAVS